MKNIRSYGIIVAESFVMDTARKKVMTKEIQKRKEKLIENLEANSEDWSLFNDRLNILMTKANALSMKDKKSMGNLKFEKKKIALAYRLPL